MSNYHASIDTCGDIAPAPRRALLDALAILQDAVATVATRFAAAVQRHVTQRRLHLLSDHMLRDFGFERDWDGTIRSLRDDA